MGAAMPFKEATFWYGTILFTTGIYFWIVGGDPMTIGIVLTIVGLAMSVYSVLADKYSTLPRLRAWVALLLITYAALGFDIYDRYHPGFARPHWPWLVGVGVLFVIAIFFSVNQKQIAPVMAEAHTKLAIHSANYRAWKEGGETCDVTEFLRKSIAGDGLVFAPIENDRFVIGGNNLVKTDPFRYEEKRLEVTYSYKDSLPRTIVRPEHGRLALPEDSEIERLDSEVKRLTDELATKDGWRKPFESPTWELVDDQIFKNVTVELDGKQFWRCKFEGATLVFRGKAPVEFAVGNEFKTPISLKTDNPAVKFFANLEQMFRRMSEKIEEGLIDSRGRMFPENFSVSTAPKQSKEKPSSTIYPIPALRMKILEMCSELQGFLAEHGDTPKVSRPSPEQTQEEYLLKFQTILAPWKAKFLGDYRLKFAESVPRLRDEVRAKAMIDDGALNAAIENAANNPNDNANAVQKLITRLWDVASRVNA